MLALLRLHYCSADGALTANGGEFALLTHVRDAAGFAGERTIDALAMAMWKAGRWLLHGHEIKCSRSDWLTELRTPEKAQAWCDLVDRFWLVAADDTIVKREELPEGWGLMVACGERLEVRMEAGPLREEHARARHPGELPLPPGFGRSALAAMLRVTVRTAAIGPETVRAARAAARADTLAEVAVGG